MDEGEGLAPAAKLVTPLDVELLRAVQAEGKLISACRRLGIGRDRGVYRLARLARLARGPVVRTRRGGGTPGGTHLTPRGLALLEAGVGPVHAGVRPRTAHRGGVTSWTGVWRARPEPSVMVAPGLRLVVAFRAEEGERVRVQVDPRSVLLSSGRFPTSARNVLRGRVVSRLHLPGWQTQVNVRLGRELLSVLVTPGAERELGLRAGSPVWIYLKATSIRRI